jgi:hypothetical protein
MWVLTVPHADEQLGGDPAVTLAGGYELKHLKLPLAQGFVKSPYPDALSSDALWPGRLGLEAFCAVVVGSALSSLARLFSWLLAFTALRVGVGAQPQRDVGRLHRLLHHTH